jgi:Kelch motif protein
MRALGFRFAAALGAAVALLGACSGSPDRDAPSPLPSSSSSGSPSIRPVPNRSATKKWVRLADAPTVRLEVASAVLDGKLYVAGGLAEGGASKKVEIYDPATDKWSSGPDLPVTLHHASGVAYRGAFLVIGGFAAGGLSDATDSVWSLGCPAGFHCPATKRWFKLFTLRRPRAAGVAGVVGDSIVVAGGQAGGVLIGPTEIFDFLTKAWRDAAPIPTPRDHLAGASDGKRSFYTAGGRELSIDSVLTAAERFDLTTGRWESLPPIPTARGGFGGAYAAGGFVTIGGEGPRGTYADVEAYDPASRSWSALAGLRPARHAMGVGVIDSRIYIAAGGPQVGGSYSRLLEVIDLG